MSSHPWYRPRLSWPGLVVLVALVVSGGLRANSTHNVEASDELAQRLQQALIAKGNSYQPRTEHFNEKGTPLYTNRLILEDSPYLLQHAHNPVNWYPWGEEAFAAARQSNKPVLLSIGYATCHWCHVMERESFENEAIAEKLNEYFIAVKVDREQLPDVDATYMTAVQLMTGSGGWPMNTFLTADARPFHGGTYFPPALFDELLDQIHQVWTDDSPKVHEFADRLAEAVAIGNALTGEAREVGDREVYNARRELLDSFDDLQGGFGPAPKFPREPVLAFLLELAQRNGDAEALDAADFTLQRITAGGIHDHVGGGFHRYAVDPDWLVPHFEKMLYNQAWLTTSLMHAYRLTGDVAHARTARRALDYVIREMTNAQGGFYSATDADSEGAEGTFFIWTPDEIKKVLGEEAAEFAMSVWGVTDAGNFEHKNILHLRGSLTEVAADYGLPVQVLTDRLDEYAAKLLAHRKRREAPLTDEKVITEWNAMMANALAVGYDTFGDERYLRAATGAIDFLWQHNQRDNGRLLRAHFNGQSTIEAGQADYAYLAQTMLTLHDLTGDEMWMARVKTLVDHMNQQFWDNEHGAYFIGAPTVAGAALPSRPKDLFDNAVATGNSIALQVLARLWHRTGEDAYRERAEQLLRAFSGNLSQGASAYAYLLVGALELLHGESGARQYAARGKVRADARIDGDQLIVSVAVVPGWHINAQQPLQDYLVKTRLSHTDDSPLTNLRYPKEVRRTLGFQSEQLALYEGRFDISADVPEPDATLQQVSLQLQACSDEICLAPETLHLKVSQTISTAR